MQGLLLVACDMTVVARLVYGHWVLNKLIGISICIAFVICAMLLLCLFVYDIFWVFFSERLKIMFPRNLLCGVSASDFMMLGLGDMPIGLVSALAAGFLTHSPQPALLYLVP
ncbi:hypothetical protein HID58_029785 [Brassica napus]|uniref:Uncharacterized protein n=1 Tax=Brassica napus TaxID=3708 RepID=A0ABQ8CE19_BRANA|nr:hypothetical protein HID58_029785 [Brassica napus]